MVATSPDQPHSTYLVSGTTDSLNFLRSIPLAAHRHRPEKNQLSNRRPTMPGPRVQGRDGRVQPATMTGDITHSDQQQRPRSSKLTPADYRRSPNPSDRRRHSHRSTGYGCPASRIDGTLSEKPICWRRTRCNSAIAIIHGGWIANLLSSTVPRGAGALDYAPQLRGTRRSRQLNHLTTR